MNIFKHTISLLAVALLPAASPNAYAQSNITDTDAPVIVPSTPSRSISYRNALCKVKIAANVDYTISSDAGWCAVTKNGGGFNFRVSANMTKSPRVANIKIYNAENDITRYVSITQEMAELEQYVETPNTSVKPKGASAPGTSSLLRTIDGYTTTYYDYSAAMGSVTESSPLNLDYAFSGQHIDKITYVPNGITHGYMGKAKVSYKKVGGDGYTDLGTYDFTTDGTTVEIDLGKGGADNVDTLRISVWDGLDSGDGNEKFGCAEMQFAMSLNNCAPYNIFADDLLTKLRPEATADMLDTIGNPFVSALAEQLLNGTYDTKYRAARYCCLPPASSVGDSLLTGKNYDIYEGVTGIKVNPGKFAVVVAGLKPGVDASVYVTAYRPKSGNTGPAHKLYSLKNGMNVINYTADSAGLAYIKYNSNVPEKYDSIGVHFINGVQNGYVTSKMSNDEITGVLKKAQYMCMDILGERVHLVFEGKSLLKHTIGRYRQLINVYDTVINWEHRLLGLEKYNKIPKNRTLFYVNYDYFMYQTGLGASAKYDVTEILDPRKFLTKSLSTIWGVSHEWGHQHQSPYYTWGGMAEVSNNIFSSYNLIHFGENTVGFLVNNFKQGYREYFQEDYFATHDSISPQRLKAYAAAGKYAYSPKLQEAFLAMKDARIPSRAEDPLHTASFIEHSENLFANRLTSVYEIGHYFDYVLGNKDVFPDFFESIRNTEKGTNKYELIAAVQKGKSARLAVLKELYPNSVWVKNNYVYEKSKSNENDASYILNFIYKMSTVTGYNMFPYFEQWGYLRQIATYTSDYGDHYYCLTKDMYDEFKADMDARVESGELKEMSDELIHAISSYPIPTNTPVITVPN